MSGERYFLEVWFRGDDASPFREKTGKSSLEPHPHITFGRPFGIVSGEEDAVKQKIIDYCSLQKPILFTLEGKGSFGEVDYVPVIGEELQKFNDGLERLLNNSVDFDKKLNYKKILHVALATNIDSFPKTESAMLRLICLRNKKIWFSFDFVTGQVLDREQSLDESRWNETKRARDTSKE